MNTISKAAYDGDIVSRLRSWRGLHLAHSGTLFEEAATEIEVQRACTSAARDEIARLRLTDEEREAVNAARIELNTLHCFEDHHSHTLRKLLERLA